MINLETDSGLKIIISDNVQNEMKERLILLEDLEKALLNAQKNRERFFNQENLHYLTRMRINNVTYWVEYEEKGEELFVDNVYAHRIEVVEG